MQANSAVGQSLYRVARLHREPPLDAAWEKPEWSGVPVLTLDHCMGSPPDLLPGVTVRAGYDEHAFYYIFRVQDRCVRSVVKNYQGPVCTDSCVEFFFVPGPSLEIGYFNLEINAGGTALFAFHRDGDSVPIDRADFDAVRIAHSLPATIDPEMASPTTWTLECRLPFALVSRYAGVARPKPGDAWRANFYKCGDATSQPHWLTWAPVSYAKPNFHLPAFFGTLIFEL